MSDQDRHIHYYSWEGDPCRLLPLENSAEGLSADMYVQGEGFLPTSVSSLLYKAVRITEAEFKDMVQGLILAGRRHG